MVIRWKYHLIMGMKNKSVYNHRINNCTIIKKEPLLMEVLLYVSLYIELMLYFSFEWLYLFCLQYIEIEPTTISSSLLEMFNSPLYSDSAR